MKRLYSGVGLIALLATGSVFAQVAQKGNPNTAPAKSGADTSVQAPAVTNDVKKDTTQATTPANATKDTTKDSAKTDSGDTGSDIYDVKLNSNWQFSGLIDFDSDSVFIPLKFLPSDLLGNLTESHFVERKGQRFLQVSNKMVTKKDAENLSIEMNLSEEYFKTQQVDLDRQKKQISKAIDAIYMNYDINFSTTTLQDTRGTFDFHYASHNNWTIDNSTLWDGKEYVRLGTTWQKEFADNSTLILGDTSGNALSGFNSLNFFGFRYATSYYNNSQFLEGSLPTIPLSGFAVNPSRLDLYLNNQLVQQTEIATGKYNLNIPFQNRGFGVAQAYVYDVTGKPVIVSVPFYSNNEVLKKGANEYDISGGLIRQNLGTSSFSYDRPIFNALYKGGWFNNYTQDAYLQTSSLYSVGSVLGHWIPFPQLGLINLGVSLNSEKQVLYHVGYERVSSAFSFGVDYEKSNLFCFGYDQLCLKQQMQLYSGFNLPYHLGSVNMSYISRASDQSRSNIASVQWNKQLTKNISMYTNFSNLTGSGAPNKTIYVGVSINFDHHIYTNSAVTHDNTGSSFQQGIYRGEDDQNPALGYGSITYNKSSDVQSENLFYGARLRDLAYQLNVYKDQKVSTGNLDVSGAISYIPSANYFSVSKQITSGLAFVKVENLTTPAEILHENRYSGMTDNQGRYLIPDAIALNNEKVTIDINKLPKSITLDKYQQEFYVPFSGAVEVDFKAKPLPYLIKIHNVKAGAIFNIDKDYYVVGDDGLTSVETEGHAVLPMDNGNTCDIDITNKQKEYTCTAK